MKQHKFFCIVLNILKHLVLFTLVNFLGVFIVFFIIASNRTNFINKVMSDPLDIFPLVAVAMAFCVIPYAILLRIIKLKKNTSLWWYVASGAICSTLAFILVPTTPNGTIIFVILYAILLQIIKLKKKTSVWWYVAGGVIYSTLVFIPALTDPVGAIIFVVILAIGVFCGLLYGVLDKTLQVDRILGRCHGKV